jgi:hypothetical protein
LTPGRYCAFLVDLGNYGRDNITPRLIFGELRKRSSDDFSFTHYHWRRPGNFVLQVYAATPVSAIEAKVSNAINRVLSAKLNRSFSSIFRDFDTLQALVQHAREKTGVAPGSSDVVKNGRSIKVAAVFVESNRNLTAPWPREIDTRVEILGMVQEDPTTLLALYRRPREGGDFGYVANAVKVFFARSGIIVKSTARGIGVIDDIIAGRIKP